MTSTKLDAWIERNFTGHGMALRHELDPLIPGEPLMSMSVAKDLTRRAVAHFAGEGRQDGWQDIATAPRDRSDFILAYMSAVGPRSTSATWAGNCWKYDAGTIGPDSPDLLGWQPLPAPPLASAPAPQEGESK